MKITVILKFSFLLILGSSGLTFAQSSDIEAVKAASHAYYEALSARDLMAMEQVWARGQHDALVGPPIRPKVHNGWDSIKKQYEAFWPTLDELSVSMEEPVVEVNGLVAWVYGIEQSRRKPKNGDLSEGTNFGTSIFVKENGRWLLVYHNAGLIPKPN